MNLTLTRELDKSTILISLSSINCIRGEHSDGDGTGQGRDGGDEGAQAQSAAEDVIQGQISCQVETNPHPSWWLHCLPQLRIR